jgi:CelD/BcsL family acetyltransferase involved in cellulose biosynthesis
MNATVAEPIAALQVLGTDQREAWIEVLEQAAPYDFYHLPGYHELAEKRGEGTARLFVYREESYLIALPLLLRSVESVPGLEQAGRGVSDATSVYGYAGPVASSDDIPPAVAQNFRCALQDKLRELGVIAAFSRLHPLLAQRELLAGIGECLPGGQTVSIDLLQPPEVQRTQYRSDHKRGINRTRRLGMVAKEDPRLEHLDRFFEIYTATMRRVGAADYYFFEPDYFADLASRLGSTLKLFMVWSGQEPACAGLFTACHGMVQYHLGGTADKYLELAPMKLLFDEVRLWAVAEGHQVFHLGGGVGSQPDSLFHFKAGFSDARQHFFTWRWILDPAAFAGLVAEQAKWNARTGHDSASPGYFPAYRAPSIPAVVPAP